MAAFLAKRLALAVVTVYAVITLTFFMIRLMPGNAMSYLEAQLSAQGGLTTQQIAAKVQEAYGVQPKGPLWHQYISYVGNAFQGNFGTSILDPGKTVLSVVAGALPWTLLVVGLALLISFAVGIIVGTLIAAFPQSMLAKIATGIVSFLAAVPNYIIALVLIYLVADQEHLLPASGPYSLTVTPGWNASFASSVLQHALLPVLSYVVVAFGSWALTMKGSVSTILGADYVRAGESWGLSRYRVTRSYVGRNAMLPMVTNLGLSLGYMFGGSVFIETFFVYPGLGYYLVQSVNQRDYPVMMGCFLLITIAVVVSNLIVDLTYPLVDPRIMSPGRARKAGLTVSGRAAETRAEDVAGEAGGMKFFRDLWRICRADKPALIGAVVILVYLVVAIAGPFVTHVSYQKNPALAYLPPSFKYPLGTDFLGNSVLSELILGTRPIMEVGLAAAVMVVTVGVTVGLVTGYLGGVVDQVVMRITDVFLTIPGLPLVIVIAAIVRTTNPLVLAAILSVTGWAGLARAVRSQALSLRTSDFIDAAKVQGLPLRNIVFRQLLPNIGPYVAIHFLLAVTDAIYAEVGLYLLGVAPITGTNWGIMINLAIGQGALYTSQSAYYLFSPMLAIVFLQVALVYFSRAMDRLFNPRLRVQ